MSSQTENLERTLGQAHVHHAHILMIQVKKLKRGCRPYKNMASLPFFRIQPLLKNWIKQPKTSYFSTKTSQLNSNRSLHQQYPTRLLLLQIKLHAYFFSIILTLEKFRKKMQKANKRQRNARISLKRRQNLIDLIEKEQFTLCRAARKLNIKFSTARLILKKYEETGTFFNKNMRRVRKGKEEHVKLEKDDSSFLESSMEDQELNETLEKGKTSAEEGVAVKSQETVFPFANNCFFFWNSLPYYYVPQPDQIVQSSL